MTEKNLQLQINVLMQQKTLLEKKLSDLVAQFLHPKLREIFKIFLDNDIPVTWTQYIPYFNDGEPCVFSVNDFLVQIPAYGDFYAYDFMWAFKGDLEDKDHPLVDAINSPTYNFPKDHQIYLKICDDWHNFVGLFANDLEKTFGSHAMVTVTHDAVVSEAYQDHD